MAAETLNFKKVSKVIGIKQSLKAVGKVVHWKSILLKMRTVA